MFEDINLLITTRRGHEEDACSEIWYLLREVGDSSMVVSKTGIHGLIAAKTSICPFEAIKRFRNIMNTQPEEFRYTFRVIPIQRVVQTKLETIEKTIMDLISAIQENESFRITVEKRFTQISTRKIIETVATNICGLKVDLENPDKIILIEIVGKYTGISIIRPSDIFSTIKESAHG